MTTYKVKTRLVIDVNQSHLGVAPDKEQAVQLEPPVLSATWTKNNHHEADILTVTVGFREAGIDPRQLVNARCRFALWDDNYEDFDAVKHTRFTGICVNAERKLGTTENSVEFTFHDFTTLFLHMKPFKPNYIPLWTDSLKTAWQKICDGTGWQDPHTGKVVSTVSELRNRIVFYPPELADKPLGSMVSDRFHKIDKPTPPQRSDAWAVWRWCVESLGFVTFIDKDQCIVASINEFYRTDNGTIGFVKPYMLYGSSAERDGNIYDLSEKVDTSLTSKGICLQSYNPLTGKVIEAFYPPPGDPRLKTKKSAAGKKSEGGAAITANEVAADYDYYQYSIITSQEALNAKALAAFEERRRQELKGKLTTADLRVFDQDGRSQVDLLNLRSGSAFVLKVDPEDLATLLKFGSEDEQVEYLMGLGRTKETARILAKNSQELQIQTSTFHVTSLVTKLDEKSFSIEIDFHNLIVTDIGK